MASLGLNEKIGIWKKNKIGRKRKKKIFFYGLDYLMR
jgi:hypothetical protein